MKVRPILFNTEMVKAIRDGIKTQTRRLVKEIWPYAPYFEDYDGIPMACDEDGDWYPAEHFSRIQPEDTLWVRETWAHPSAAEISMGADPNMYIYKADEPALTCGYDRWRPSIHMPREAARLFLRVKDVRMERLHEIMDAPPGPDNPIVKEGCTYGFEFIAVWESTVKVADRTRYGWDANPWVWVIEFERCYL